MCECEWVFIESLPFSLYGRKRGEVCRGEERKSPRVAGEKPYVCLLLSFPSLNGSGRKIRCSGRGGSAQLSLAWWLPAVELWVGGEEGVEGEGDPGVGRGSEEEKNKKTIPRLSRAVTWRRSRQEISRWTEKEVGWGGVA